MKSLNITPIEIDYVKWHRLILHSAQNVQTNNGKTLASQTTLSETQQSE